MINELYLYSFPKILKDKPSGFEIWHALAPVVYASFLLVVDTMLAGIIIMSLSLILYLLCFIEKDPILKHMKIVTVLALNFAAVTTIIVLMLFPESNARFNSVIWCIIFSVIYEIAVFIKIKNKLYSCPNDKDKNLYTAIIVGLLLIYFANKIFLKNSEYQNFSTLIMILMSSFSMLCVVIAIQKLIVYLFTRNKVSENNINKPNKKIDKNN